MRFLALFRKEFREALPWLIVAGALLLLLGGFVLQDQVNRAARDPGRWHGGSPRQMRIYSFIQESRLAAVGSLLLMISAALGLVLGGRQFWMPGFTRTWAFTLHRSVGPRTVLWAKLAATAAAFAVSLGLLWTLMFLYASRPGVLAYQPRVRVFVEGWIYVLLGLLVYLGAALSGLSGARWYTTRLVPLAVALLMGIWALAQASLGATFAIVGAAAVVLGVQVVHLFGSREY
ncbi:hypothetical protein LCGC14_1994270 [marine sediment metagenome]|uniref:ABC-2 type transporter domain-containing protein n=1 Tax=marine sediment metagenome TaxID=412755 RepID=A0A0F9FT60_9ZZZZ